MQPWPQAFAESAVSAAAEVALLSGASLASAGGIGGGSGAAQRGGSTSAATLRALRQHRLLLLPGSSADAGGIGGGGSGGSGGVHVVGFGKTVAVFASKQKPKLLEMYCDDFTARSVGCTSSTAGGPKALGAQDGRGEERCRSVAVLRRRG